MIQIPRQLSQRIRAWNSELPHHQYTAVSPVAFEGFTTLDRIPAMQAADMPRQPFPVGTAWGACWEYAWFSGKVTLPAACKGQRVVFFSGLAANSWCTSTARLPVPLTGSIIMSPSPAAPRAAKPSIC